MYRHGNAARAALLGVAVLACGPSEERARREGSPADHLPPHITRILDHGARAEWSHDGRRLLFIDGVVGDVFELELPTGAVSPRTKHYAHAGYTRAHYLVNGDLLLCGPREVDPEDPDRGRWNAELWILDDALEGPAVALGELCFEGPAVSRRSLRIAWTLSEYPQRLVFAKSEIWMGEIEYVGGEPRLTGKRRVLGRHDVSFFAFLETQNFRPPEEKELLFTAYAYRGGEVMGVDLETGEVRNYSQNWGYDETEGVFPDGRHTLVEREPDNYRMVPKGLVEIWKLALDGSGRFERLTHFSDYPGFGASNPVVRDDGRYMAFQLTEQGGGYGSGRGLFLYDLEQAAAASTP